MSTRIEAALALIDRGAPQCPHSMAAAAIVAVYSDKIRYCYDLKRWYVWDNICWQSEKAAERVDQIVLKFIINHLVPHMAGLTAYAANNMANDSYVTRVINRLQNVEKLLVRSTEFDADPFLLGTPDGVVDLRNGRVSPALPSMMISMVTGCSMAPKREKSPQWDAFIKWMTKGDKELARFLRMWFGLSLIGNTRDQKIVFLWGDSANGKSVILRAIAKAAGDYHESASPSLFMTHKNGNSSGLTPGLVKVLGRRIVTGTEVPKGAEWDTQILKQVCSDEDIAVRRLYAEETSVEPRCSVTLAGNDLPTFTGLDDAVRRRFLTVHCQAKRAEGEQLADYGYELFKAEGPQILRWLVEGALDREMNGFVEPAIVKAASAEYFSAEDVLQQFITENYDINPAGMVGVSDMFKAWQEFNKGLGRPRDMTQTMFSLRIKKMGFEPGRNARSVRVFKGLSMKSEF